MAMPSAESELQMKDVTFSVAIIVASINVTSPISWTFDVMPMRTSLELSSVFPLCTNNCSASNVFRRSNGLTFDSTETGRRI